MKTSPTEPQVKAVHIPGPSPTARKIADRIIRAFGVPNTIMAGQPRESSVLTLAGIVDREVPEVAAAPETAAERDRLRETLQVIADHATLTARTFPNAPGRGDMLAIERMAREAITNAEGLERLEDIARNSADAGWTGFTYTADTVAFFKRNKSEIMARAVADSGDFGTDTLEMIAGFQCLKSLGLEGWAVSEALNGRGDDADTVRNAMAWYALEEIARELCPDV